MSLCLYQIATQVVMFWLTPIATNVDADSPTSMQFPAVAICNNNLFTLTYLTSQHPNMHTMHNSAAQTGNGQVGVEWGGCRGVGDGF